MKDKNFLDSPVWRVMMSLVSWLDFCSEFKFVIILYMKKLIMCFMIILSFTGCKKEKNQDAELLNIKWILKSIQNTANNVSIDFPADAPKNISIVFTDSLGTVLFNGICNNGSGIYSYSPAKGEIKIEDLKTTLIGCNYVSWETYTIQNLIDASRYKIDGNLLIIYSSGDYNLFFQKE